MSFIRVGTTNALAIMSNMGTQLWSVHGDTMIFQFPLSAIVDSDPHEEHYMRGVVASRDFLCFGSSLGSIVVFNCDHLVDGHDFPLTHTINTENVPISHLAMAGHLLAAANDNGRIFLYRSDEAFVEAHNFNGGGFPCTAIAMNDQLLIAGFSSGHIRLYRTDIFELSIELTAHTRTISGLVLNSAGTMFVSCSQDQYVHVWSVPDLRSRGGMSMIKLFSELLEDRICTGVAFMSGDKIAVTSYDEEEIVILHK